MSLSKYKTTSPAKKESGKILDLDITISSSKGRQKAGCPKTIGELRVRRVIGALRQAFKLGIRRSGLNFLWKAITKAHIH